LDAVKGVVLVVNAVERMRMAEFSRVSGVPTATIKFYLREGLLHPGQRTAPNQATYGESHLRRLRLVRALREMGGLRIETIRRVLESVDGADNPWNIVGRVCDAIGENGRERSDAGPSITRAAADVDAFLAEQGLPVRAESSARAQLIEALVAVRSALGPGFPVAAFSWYSDAVRGLAKDEVDVAISSNVTEWSHQDRQRDGSGPAPARDLSEILEATVYGTVLFEPVLLALRRLWHERHAEALGLAAASAFAPARPGPTGSPG
jgi:DNA-binding transcriptional MerR regulator